VDVAHVADINSHGHAGVWNSQRLTLRLANLA
jgi:hypothetical protein